MAQLSPDDISLLMRDPSPESRQRIVEKISGQFGHDTLSENERKIAVEIFLLVLGDREPAVRKAMAQGLKNCDNAPPYVISVLAEDREDEVAIPVLQESTVLGEEELISIIRSTNATIRLIAIADREKLTEGVSGELVEKKKEEVALTLVKNIGAQINDPTYMKIADNFYDNEEMLQLMIQRKPLPSKAIKRCVNNAMDSARHSMQVHQLKSLEEANDSDGSQMDKSKAIVVRHLKALQALGANPSPYACEKLAVDMIKVGRMGPELLLTALCMGHIRFFAASLAKKSSVSFERAGTICSSPAEPLFRALYEKAGMPMSQLPVYIWMIERVVEKLVAGMQANTQETAVKMATELQTAMVSKTIPSSDVVSRVTVGLIQLAD